MNWSTYPEWFAYACQRTLVREGLLTDHPADRGGKTKHGITAATAARHGIADVSTISVEDAVQIYFIDYWRAAGCERIKSKYIAAELFDTAVLSGSGASGRFLQLAYNVLFAGPSGGGMLKVDGAVGPVTAAKVNSVLPKWEKALLNAMTGEQYNHFRHIVESNPSQQVFLRGWVGKRLDVPDDAVEA